MELPFQTSKLLQINDSQIEHQRRKLFWRNFDSDYKHDFKNVME